MFRSPVCAMALYPLKLLPTQLRGLYAVPVAILLAQFLWCEQNVAAHDMPVLDPAPFTRKRGRPRKGSVAHGQGSQAKRGRWDSQRKLGHRSCTVIFLYRSPWLQNCWGSAKKHGHEYYQGRLWRTRCQSCRTLRTTYPSTRQTVSDAPKTFWNSSTRQSPFK